MCKDVRNSYIVHKLGIQRVPYDIRNYAVMRVFGKMSWGYYAGLRFPKTGHPVFGVSQSESYLRFPHRK